jgi:LmbE family N-acetylglucosaminyl deacetylase
MGVVMSEPLIAGAGTPESTWQAWRGLQNLPECDLDGLMPRAARAVVVAPHPDDEVLACGGLLAMLAARGSHVLLVAVTDGDASHPGCIAWPPARLAQRRHDESLEGLRRLGLRHYSHVRLAIPDGQVMAHQASIATSLHSLLSTEDIVFSTWVEDGHPDHEATAQAVAKACIALGRVHVQVPVWMWHWAEPDDPRVPWNRMVRLPLTVPALHRKAHAIEAHVSQLSPQDRGAAPVLGVEVLRRLIRPHEYLLFVP